MSAIYWKDVEDPTKNLNAQVLPKNKEQVSWMRLAEIEYRYNA